MRAIRVTDRYAALPAPRWMHQRWNSTRTASCGCPRRGVITDLRPGEVLVAWSPCPQHPGQTDPDSWETVDRGTLARRA